ncbi:MAG: peptide chain release factor 1 [Caldiserica bacterium]|nr:peptide chain release factor 1 [Caldisericota bacterium]
MSQETEQLARRIHEIDERISSLRYDVDQKEIQKLILERRTMDSLFKLLTREESLKAELSDNTTLLAEPTDATFATMVEEDNVRLRLELEATLAQIEEERIPKDPDDDKNIIVEIRGGVGGDEAALFAADLFRMYSYFSSQHGLKIEVISSHPTEIGGFKEVVFSVLGVGSYKLFKFESGVHRVQRVPETEASGRIHTSTATVAVLPEAEDVDMHIDDADIKLELFHASGHGGQNVQKVETAVRMTHIPTGITASCQDERSQLKNKEKALKVLRSRVYELMKEKADSEMISERRAQIGSGMRNMRIRTYNFPQGRLTDHRIGLSLYNLPLIMEGNLDPVIDALHRAFRERTLETPILQDNDD